MNYESIRQFDSTIRRSDNETIRMFVSLNDEDEAIGKCEMNFSILKGFNLNNPG
jgi:hypothetical protein